MNSRRFATASRRVLPLRVAPHSPFQTICGEHTQGGRAKTKIWHALLNVIPNKVYLFDGRKYLCQKIEITLDDQGVQPLKKGYFYEIG